jgi:hypothetical protein
MSGGACNALAHRTLSPTHHRLANRSDLGESTVRSTGSTKRSTVPPAAGEPNGGPPPHNTLGAQAAAVCSLVNSAGAPRRLGEKVDHIGLEGASVGQLTHE